MKDRIPLEAEVAWDEFHQAVNMTSQELRAWLPTEASGEEAFPDDSGVELPELGRRVVEVLAKRKVDLTDEDAETMGRVVDLVSDKLGSPPPESERDGKWRRSLMTLGHDPLKP